MTVIRIYHGILLIVAITTALFITNASALSCYICGDNNLEEFGECGSQFQYDCSSYARRFAPNEPILCRTSRHRAPNNTYTVLKECIAQQEHVRMFPEAAGIMDNCDLLQGETYEVAYCICSGNMCNERSITEQFMTMDKNNQNNALTNGAGSRVTLAPAFVPPSGQLPIEPIVSVVGRRQPTTSDFLTENLPITAPTINGFDGVSPLAAPSLVLGGSAPPSSLPTNAGAGAPPSIPPPNDSALGFPPGQLPPPIVTNNSPSQLPSSINNNNFPSTITNGVPILTRPTPTVGDQLSSDASSRFATVANNNFLPTSHQQLNLPVTHTTQDVQLSTLTSFPPLIDSSRASFVNGNNDQLRGLQCMSCAEGNLHANEFDCIQQFPIECSNQHPLSANIRCFTRHILVSPGQNAIEKLCVTEQSLVEEYGVDAGFIGCSSLSNGRVNFCVCDGDQCNRPSIRDQIQLQSSSSNIGGIPLQIQPPSSAVASKVFGSQRCLVCGESELTTPIDCSHSYEYDCGSQYINATMVYCLTRQTRLSSGIDKLSSCTDPYLGAYNIEKRCISKDEHRLHYPDSEILLSGCGSAYEGYVKYCICQGDLCNRESLAVQTLQYPDAVTRTSASTADGNRQLSGGNQQQRVDSNWSSNKQMPTTASNNEDEDETMPTDRFQSFVDNNESHQLIRPNSPFLSRNANNNQQQIASNEDYIDSPATTTTSTSVPASTTLNYRAQWRERAKQNNNNLQSSTSASVTNFALSQMLITFVLFWILFCDY